MRYIFLLFFTVFIACACDFQEEEAATTPSITLLEPTALSTSLPPSSTPTRTPIITPEPTATETPTPTSTPTLTPTRTPLPRPFELSVSLLAISYTLPFDVIDEIAFFIQDDRFNIADISEPTNPQTIWQSDSLGDQVQGLAVIGENAFLISDNELLVWSIDNFQNPVVIATMPVLSGIPYLDVEERLLYLVSITVDSGQITTIDLSAPGSPIELGTADLSWSKVLHPFTITQKHIYLINDDHIQIVDISDPVLSVPIAQISVPTNINSEAEVVDNLLYIGTHTGIFIYDITNIESPQQVGQYANFQINGMNIDGDLAYLFTEICGFELSNDGEITGGCGRLMEMVNFFNPAQPELEGLIRLGVGDSGNFVESVTMQENLIYFESGGKLYILDTSDFVR